jgi:hypothetical protein
MPFPARGAAAWPSVEAVLARALAKDPRLRFQSIATFADAFRATSRQPFSSPPARESDHQTLDAAIDLARTLAPAPYDALSLAWFAMRAAVARNDVELLAASDILVERAGNGWAACALASHIARARSDVVRETEAIQRFLATAPRGPKATPALLAAADILEGAARRGLDVGALANWAARRLKTLWNGSKGTPVSQSATVAYAALALARTGLVAPPLSLQSRLEALLTAGEVSVWLCALAHDVLADPRFLAGALAAQRPECPIERGFALLRLYRLTGDPHFIARARKLASVAASAPSPGLATALLLIELEAPEHANLHFFHWRISPTTESIRNTFYDSGA